mgnify:CR=1 FL=1
MDQEIISIADKVIEMLKQRKIMEMRDLVKETGADESDIKLIISLLEKEEMVEVEYSLTKVLVSWNDEADRLLMKMKKNQRITSWDPEKHVSKTSKREQRSRFLTPLKPVREIRGSEEQYFSDASESPAANANSEPSKFSIFDGSGDGSKIEKQIKEMESKLRSKEGQRDSRRPNSSNSLSKQEDKHKTRQQKPPSPRTSTFNIGAFAVKQPEKKDSIFEEEKPSAKHSMDNDSYDNFEKLNSKPESILGSKPKVSHSGKQQRAQPKSKKDREIDKELKEIEKTLLLRLGEPLKQNGENYDIVELKESDIVNKVKKDLERKSRQAPASRTLLNTYKPDPSEDQPILAAGQNASVHSDRDILSKLKGKLDEIVSKRSEILELNKEKTMLFDDSHLSLKSKLITEVSALNDIVDSKDNKIKQLQSKIAELPNSLKKLESDVRSLRLAESELNSQFNLSMDGVRALRGKVKESREDGLKELVLLKGQLSEQEKELQRMGDIYSSFKSNEDQLNSSIGYIRDRIRNSQAELLNLEKELEDVLFNSDSIRLRIEEIGKSLRQTNSQFEKSAAKLRDLDDLDLTISQIEDSYRSLKSDMGSRLEGYEKEMLSLKESIQLDFTKKYLQELERLTLQNESEFKSLILSEERLDSQIGEKKKELLGLIEQAKALQSTVSGSDPTKLDLSGSEESSANPDSFYSINPEDKKEILSEVEKLNLSSSDLSQKEEKPGIVSKLDQFFNDLTKKIK